MSGAIAFAGMTHLGLVSAAAAAAKGFQVVGFDPDPGRIAAIRDGQLPVSEPGLAEILADHAGRLTFAHEAERLRPCAVVVVAADVATDSDNQSDLGGIESLIARILPHLDAQAVLVVLCQVPPGFTRRIARVPSHLFYQVETLVFGRAVARALTPERIIVGQADAETAIPSAYQRYLESFACPILPMRYESAELAKMAINAFLAAQVGTTNLVADLATRIGADWNEIAPALRLDARIGPSAYLKPGLGLAGGNLERDLATLVRLGSESGADVRLIEALTDDSRRRRAWLLATLHRAVLAKKADPLIGVWGLAYKENTRSTKNSAAVELIESLPSYRFQAYDPLVPTDGIVHSRLVATATAMEAARGADALVIATPWPQFQDIDVRALRQAMREPVLIDPHRLFARAPGFDHYVLGAAVGRLG